MRPVQSFTCVKNIVIFIGFRWAYHREGNNVEL